MSIQIYKVGALFKKDIKDALKNGNWLLVAVLPLLFTILYRYMDFGLPPVFVLTLGLLMNMSLQPISTMAMMIAEEKEKHTLRTLMLSNVSAGEFLLSKALVIFLLTQAVNLCIYAVTGVGLIALPRFLIITTLTCTSMILFGALVGLISKNQMNTGMLATPIALLMMLPAIFAEIMESIAVVAQYTPTRAMMLLITESGNLTLSIVVLITWIVLAAVLFMLVYQRKRLD